MEIGDEEDIPLVREESQDDTRLSLADIPVAGDDFDHAVPQKSQQEQGGSLSVSDRSDGETMTRGPRRARDVKEESVQLGHEEGADDKKKMALNTTYDGFSIYGRILCLVVKRRGTARSKELAGGAGQAMMEEWISSTQAAEGQMLDD